MDILSTVTKGRHIGPQIHTVAGNNGVGKTTFAASFPSAIILDLEKGSEHIDVARIPAHQIPNFSAFQASLKELKEKEHPYKTVVIDSVEALESLIGKAVCEEGSVETIEKYEGGYGKGYQRARELMRDVMIALRDLKDKGLTSILVAHTQIKTHTDPAMNQSYDRVIMRCNDKMASVIRDLSDNVFYATYKVFTTKENGKTKAFGDGQRVMYTQYRPGFDAKNRLDLPLEIPLSYEAFAEACAHDASCEELITEINEMAEKLEPKIKASAQEMIVKFKNNATKLKEVKNRLMTYVAA